MLPFTRVRWSGLVGAVLVMCVLTGCTAGGSHPPAATPGPGHAGTTVVHYRPWAPTGLAAGIGTAHRANGSCWTASIASSRPDAYRCIDDHNQINDPCFASSYQHQAVACAYPSPTAVTLITLTQPLPAGNPQPTEASDVQTVWLIVLDDGELCFANTGMAPMAHNMSLTYTCPRGDLYGEPDHNTVEWTIAYQPVSSTNLSTQPVARAYE